MVATMVLAKVDGKRLQKAVEGMDNGAYEVVLSYQGEDEIRGVVKKKIGKTYGGGAAWYPYGVRITPAAQGCECPDWSYRQSHEGAPCKHILLTLLWSIRHPHEQPQEGEHKPNLKLARVREGFCG